MITKETKSVKTWGGFNLTILKVKSKSIRKNRSSYNKTYKPPRSTSYCYPPVELTDTTMCKFRIHGLLLSWILHQIQAHPLVFSLSFNGSKDYVKETSSKISQEIHINYNKQHKNVARVFLIYLG